MFEIYEYQNQNSYFIFLHSIIKMFVYLKEKILGMHTNITNFVDKIL